MILFIKKVNTLQQPLSTLTSPVAICNVNNRDSPWANSPPPEHKNLLSMQKNMKLSKQYDSIASKQKEIIHLRDNKTY